MQLKYISMIEEERNTVSSLQKQLEISTKDYTNLVKEMQERTFREAKLAADSQAKLNKESLLS